MRPERRGKMAQTSGQKGGAHPLAVVELVAGFVAGAVGLSSALLFLSRPGTQPLWEAVGFLPQRVPEQSRARCLGPADPFRQGCLSVPPTAE